MENWKTISILKACNSAAQKQPDRKLTSVRNQSISRLSLSAAISWMQFLSWQMAHSTAESGTHFQSASAVGEGDRKIISSRISCYRVADTSGLCSSIRPAEVPATRRGWGIRWSQTGSCRLPNKVEAWTVCCCMFPRARHVRACCSAVWLHWVTKWGGGPWSFFSHAYYSICGFL